MADFATARLRLVDNQLRTSNVTDHRILTAMGEVERERFLPADRQALAYADVAHPLGGGRFLAAPAPFARLVQLAEITHPDRVLDVGCGTGYSTAVLARLGSEVTGLEANEALAGKARANLADTGVGNAAIVVASFDGAGLPTDHFDVIVVEGALDAEPVSLFTLLRDGGRLVALIGAGGQPVAHVFVKSGGEVAGRSEFNTSLPPLAAAPRDETFVF
ncbi:MAG: Protein-L-isoaspartate O-methyltransferase [Devosia sp.]|uniref:protein-L-isoaspartate O-methyltransferase family protein n=1 Tax=Devosia sp. TaxID=1871048 RepID=UPI002611CDA5|nr:protein-L-isoaspartate O-methyltransferase [Devosia sp.]MDB5538574.1 Protein-L-isoaspartate O-methyltransferase [Devosia sp.]